MKSSIIFLISVISLSISASVPVVEGVKLSTPKMVNGVEISDAKVGDTRIFLTNQSVDINADLETVYSNIVNFTEKCNSDYKKKREFLSKSFECKFHNNDIVESKIIKDLKSGFTALENETERYLVFRHVYNRGHIYFYDLITVRRYTNSQGVSEIEVIHKAMPDSETKNYLDKFEKFKSAFAVMTGTYTITALDKNTTRLNYKYLSKTDHWLANKSFILGPAYDALAEGTGFTVQSIIQGSSRTN